MSNPPNPTKTVYQYIHFVMVPTSAKTGQWDVFNIKYGSLLGSVKWHGSWRQYCFFPEGDTVFSDGCLEDVQSFIRQLMEERKVKHGVA